MLDKATLTLGDNRRVDLSQTVIFLTSNLGGGEITELMNGGMGFVQPKDIPAAGLDQKVERTAVEAARRKFSPEFMNRLDKVVCFHPLKRKQLEEVLDIELGQVQQRVLETAKGQFLFRVTGPGKEFLWRAALEACHRAPRCVSPGESASYGADPSRRPGLHRLGPRPGSAYVYSRGRKPGYAGTPAGACAGAEASEGAKRENRRCARIDHCRGADTASGALGRRAGRRAAASRNRFKGRPECTLTQAFFFWLSAGVK